MSRTSVYTFLLCTNRETFYIPQEIRRKILIELGIISDDYLGDICFYYIPIKEVYRKDLYLEILNTHIPDFYLCVQYKAMKCFEMYHKLDKLNRYVYYKAAVLGDVQLIQWLWDHDVYNGSEDVCDWQDELYEEAITYGHVDVLKWMHAHYFPKSRNACRWAVMYKQFECLRWLTENDFYKHPQCCELAVMKNQPEMLKWLIDHQFPKVDKVYIAAIHAGRREMFKLLLEHDFPKCESAYDAAVTVVNEETLQFLIDNNFPRSKTACYLASANPARIKCLLLLIRNQFPGWLRPAMSLLCLVLVPTIAIQLIVLFLAICGVYIYS